MPEVTSPAFVWRPMSEHDLDAVAEVAAVCFPDHFEGRACFENRLTLYPEGCFVLVGEYGLEGYLVAYPWLHGSVPALNTRIGAIPTDADAIYLHDLALLPSARGRRAARPMLARLAAAARAQRFHRIALVAVNDAAGFWEKHGYLILDDPAMGVKLVSYGPDARYMTLDL